MIQIRRMDATDLSRVTELWRQLVHCHVALDKRLPEMANDGAEKWQGRLSELLDDPTCRVLVAEVDGDLVGFVTGFIRYAPEVFAPLKTGNVADIYVLPDRRRQGVAGRLLSALSIWFRDEQVEHIEMSVVNANPAAVGFWRGVGAVPFTARLWLPTHWDQSTG